MGEEKEEGGFYGEEKKMKVEEVLCCHVNKGFVVIF